MRKNRSNFVYPKIQFVKLYKRAIVDQGYSRIQWTFWWPNVLGNCKLWVTVVEPHLLDWCQKLLFVFVQDLVKQFPNGLKELLARCVSQIQIVVQIMMRDRAIRINQPLEKIKRTKDINKKLIQSTFEMSTICTLLKLTSFSLIISLTISFFSRSLFGWWPRGKSVGTTMKELECRARIVVKHSTMPSATSSGEFVGLLLVPQCKIII